MEFNTRSCSGTSRAGVLALVCAALFGVYLFVVYQRTGEILQITWRKQVVKTNSVVQDAKTQIIDTYFQTGIEEESSGTSPSAKTSNVPGPTNLNHNVRIESHAPGNRALRLPDKQKHVMRFPTNAVWYTKPRSGPGMRIAFP